MNGVNHKEVFLTGVESIFHPFIMFTCLLGKLLKLGEETGGERGKPQGSLSYRC